ncbi:p24 complex component, partial [Coelomomyces lativittatus]
VSDPAGTSLYTVANEHTGNFEYTAVKDGAYTYCFTNHASVSIVNPVQFTFFQETDLIGDPKALVDPVQKSIDQLSKAIHGVKAEQRYFSHREKAHFATANSSNVRILWWSILQVLTLVGVCLFQVFYLKHFFETKRRL